MCNKVCHKTTWGAAQHIITLKNLGKIRRNREMGAYWCEEHQAYHITSNIKKGCIFKTDNNVTRENREAA